MSTDESKRKAKPLLYWLPRYNIKVSSWLLISSITGIICSSLISTVTICILVDIKHSTTLAKWSKAIISNGQWNILDFGTVEKTLTSKLNDDDIRAVLVCTDSRNKLKRLYLINCNPITYGLRQPLEGSVVLEQLDLDKNQESMSVEAIVPFLVSIIDKHDNSLKHLTLLNVWLLHWS